MWARVKSSGFTLVEILIVISVIGVITGFVVVNFYSSFENTAFKTAQSDLTQLANATRLYVAQENTYPPDAGDPGIPAEIKKYIETGSYNNQWPKGPWNNSNYDYDAWDIVKPGAGGTNVFGQDGIIDTYQISIRFCTYGEKNSAGGTALCKSRMPRQPWAATWDSNDNAMYYCIKGYCRANNRYTTWDDGKGYGINTPGNKGIPTDDNK